MTTGVLREYHDDDFGGGIAVETYYVNGEKHREDGPAQIMYREDDTIKYEMWYLRGKLHRDNAPAVVWYDRSYNKCRCEYWLDDVRYQVVNY